MKDKAIRRKDMHKELAELKLRITKALREAKKNGIRAEDLLAKALSLGDKPRKKGRPR